MSDGKQRAAVPTPAVDTCHGLLLWLIPQLDKLPRARRFTLGERLEQELIEVLGLLIRAAYQRDKRESLAEANTRLAVSRHLWRLCFELRSISIKPYEHGSLLMVDLGRQIGGWLRSLRDPA